MRDEHGTGIADLTVCGRIEWDGSEDGNRGKKAGAPIFRLRRFDAVDSLHHVPLPATHCALNRAELEALLGELYGEVATLKRPSPNCAKRSLG